MAKSTAPKALVATEDTEDLGGTDGPGFGSPVYRGVIESD
jgi:hypothetical protein